MPGFLLIMVGLVIAGPWLTMAGIVACLGIIAATFPLLRRITGPETGRNE